MMRTMIAAMLGVAMVVTNFTDRCIYLEKALCEIEKTIYNIPYSLIETPEGYELILYDKEKREVFSMVYSKEPWVCEVAEGVFEIGVSTGSPARYTFYFRREDGKMSSGFFGSLTLPFKPHNTQILYLSLLLAYFFVKFEKIIRASLH